MECLTLKPNQMKKILVSLALVLAGTVGFAQAPDAINYQAVARDGAGILLATQNLDVRVGIYSGVGAGVLGYEETHTVTTNSYGQFSLKIGEGTPTMGTFSAIAWSGDVQNLKVEVDDGTGYVDLGTSQLVSVPYAIHANTADVAGPWALNGSNAYYNNGYVGIGTDTPGAGLSLESTAGYGSALGLKNTGGGTEWRLASWTDGTLRMVKTTGTTFSAMVVEPVDGYVGIGTSTPDQKLSVHAESGISYIRVSDNTSGPASGLRMGMSGSGNAYIINDEATSSLSLGTNGTSQMRIMDNGRVGINELTPDQMLHIKQDVANKGFRIEHQSATDYWENGVGTTTKNYKFYYNNLFRADISSVDGAYTQSSDRRLKKDITYMGSVLERIMDLKPATYNYIDNEEGAVRSTGFVAQEVQEVFPNLVRDMEDGYKGVVYDGFAVISIRAIQELNEQVTQLQEEVKQLKEAINQ